MTKPKRSQEWKRAWNGFHKPMKRSVLGKPQKDPGLYADRLATYIERIESHAHDEDFSYKVPDEES